jgi:hypothetical protein
VCILCVSLNCSWCVFLHFVQYCRFCSLVLFIWCCTLPTHMFSKTGRIFPEIGFNVGGCPIHGLALFWGQSGFVNDFVKPDPFPIGFSVFTFNAGYYVSDDVIIKHVTIFHVVACTSKTALGFAILARHGNQVVLLIFTS